MLVPRYHAPAWERIPSLDTTYCSQSSVSVPTEDRGNQGTQHSGRPCRVSAKAPTQPTQAVKPSGAINPINITVALAILLSSRPATQQKIGAGLLEWTSPCQHSKKMTFLMHPIIYCVFSSLICFRYCTISWASSGVIRLSNEGIFVPAL